MIKIRIKPRGDEYKSSYLVVNDIEDKKSSASYDKNDKKFYGFIQSKRIARILLSESISELQRHFHTLELPYKVEWNDIFNMITLNFRTYAWKATPSMSLGFYPDWEQWAKPYSIAEYAEVFERVTRSKKREGILFFQSDELISSGFGLRCQFSSRDLKFNEEINRCLKELREICGEVDKLLITSARKNSLITFFNFPTSIKTTCEQYLIYFVQFLDDLGIKASAELKEDAHQVLFSVTPTDGPTALSKIRDALDVYLQLPGMSGFSSTALVAPDMAVQQLRANVLHLQSQLALAQAVHAAKDATIEALGASNFQYRQLISSEKKTDKDSEALLGDTIHVTKVEAKGVRVDLPLILRRLKRKFSKEEET
jgi:hypothetical protein